MKYITLACILLITAQLAVCVPHGRAPGQRVLSPEDLPSSEHPPMPHALKQVDWRLGQASPSTRAFVYKHPQTGEFEVVYDPERPLGDFEYALFHGEAALVSAAWDDTINATGWGNLEIHGNPSNGTDPDRAEAAGYIEGQLTGMRMRQMYENTFTPLTPKVTEFITKNIEFVNQNIANFPDEPFWHQVSLLRTQLKGLKDGYNSACQQWNGCDLDDMAFEFLNLGGDLDAIQSAMAAQAGKPVDPIITGEEGKCSALIKLTEGNRDLLVSHVTWTELTDMLRIYKFYDLPFHTSNQANAPLVPGTRMQFSSFPGALFSGDDWYVMNTGLVTLETTFGNSNPELWQYVTPQTVMEWMRNMAANRLADSGRRWTEVFALQNSGTYNNQWMIVDYKLFSPGSPTLAPETFWILEQLPKYIETQDVTQILNSEKYWSSYNIPYFPAMQERSGFDKLVQQYGDFYNYTAAPRAKIFDARHESVNDVDTMKNLMRYNNFKNDPLARCNCTPPYSGENGISARSDLNDPNGVYPIDPLKLRNHAGIDCKITSSQLMQTYSSVALSGPTNTDLPTFEWATSYYKDTKHVGIPAKFDFPFVDMAWTDVREYLEYHQQAGTFDEAPPQEEA